MQSPSLVLVFAQSGRFIAESATRAGYTVRLADCFGDADTLRLAEHWHALPPLSELSSEHLLSVIVELSEQQPCWLVCGTGIEQFYPLLAELPPHIQFAGNPLESFFQLRQPQLFFSLLETLALPFPEVAYTRPAFDYLIKDMASSGGYSIQCASSKTLSKSEYYQRYVEGNSYSVCFLADGIQAQILAWSSQHHDSDSFTLTQLQQPGYPPPACQSVITEAVSKLVTACALRGFNSLDYLLDEQGKVFILEINPRISASAELLSPAKVFGWHLAACSGRLPVCEPVPQSPVRMLHYLIAESQVRIGQTPSWPDGCHDLPHAGDTIVAGQPICTLIVQADSEAECQQQLDKNIVAALQNCHPHA